MSRIGDLLSAKSWQKYAVIGGIISIPLTVGVNTSTGLERRFSLNMILFGGVIAGYLARNESVDPWRVGTITGVIGGIPGYIWFLPQLIDSVQTWSSPISITIATVLFGIFAVLIPTMLGIIGGFIGNQIGAKAKRQ